MLIWQCIARCWGVSGLGKTNGITVAYPGNGFFAQQLALSLQEAGTLRRFVTSFGVSSDAGYLRGLERIGGQGLARILRRRVIDSQLSDKIATRPWLELLRTAASQFGASPPQVDRLWDWMSKDYSRYVARRWVPGSRGVYAYEYTALEPFERAKKEGVVCILDLPSLSSREFQKLLRREMEAFPQTRSRYDDYFASKFEERQARRDREIELADIIFTNSKLTAGSHIAHGADANKIITLPLAAPRTISDINNYPEKASPLQVVWAGTFGIGKGAHYLLAAWRQMEHRAHIKINVYGAVTLPHRLLEGLPEGIEFAGSVSQPELFQQFEKADVLLFPTLSDGFGMVVNEAFAHGLPVVTTARAGAADLVRHGENGLIIPAADADAISQALQWCLDNREQLAAMRTRALETARAWQWEDYRQAFAGKLEKSLCQTASALGGGVAR